MNRRAFIALGGTLMVAAARAQGPPAPRRIAALLANDSAAARESLAAFRQRLQQLGWRDGTNVQIDLYFGGGERNQTRQHVTKLVDTMPDVILSLGTIGITTLIEQKITGTPIVFVQVTDPVAEGFVKSLERPGGNITGFTNFGSAVGGDRLRLLKSVAPEIVHAAVMFSAAYPTPPGLIRSTETTAMSLEIELHAAGIRDENELETAIGEVGRKANGALVVLADPFMGAQTNRIIRLAVRYRLPAIYALASFADAGGLLSYGINTPVMWQGAASYVDRILRGASPNDLPVQEPTEPEIVVNMATAKALGLIMPSAVLSRATRIIQ